MLVPKVGPAGSILRLFYYNLEPYGDLNIFDDDYETSNFDEIFGRVSRWTLMFVEPGWLYFAAGPIEISPKLILVS